MTHLDPFHLVVNKMKSIIKLPKEKVKKNNMHNNKITFLQMILDLKEQMLNLKQMKK